MRYEHTEKGTIIDSPSLLIGDAWIPVDKPNEHVEDLSQLELRSLALDQETKINELEAEIEQLKKVKSAPVETEESAEEEQEVDLQSLTNKELEALAKEQGIELTADDKRNKDTRITAIVNALG